MGLTRTHRYWLLSGASLIWLILIVAPAGLAEAGFPAARLVYLLFAPICHQIPERSFSWGSIPFGVCHRCFGVYAGFAVGMLLWPRLKPAASLLQAHPRLLWLPLGVMALDVVLPNQVWDRVATGALVGFPASLFVAIAAQQFPGSLFHSPKTPISPNHEIGDSASEMAGAITSKRSAS